MLKGDSGAHSPNPTGLLRGASPLLGLLPLNPFCDDAEPLAEASEKLSLNLQDREACLCLLKVSAKA